MIALLLGILQLGVAMPPTGRCVLDEAGVLSPSEVRTIESDCLAVRTRLYIIIPASLRGMQNDQFALSVFRDWGIGKDGALVVVAPRERKWRIVTGGALKTVLSDATANDIGMTYGVPSFRRGLWGVGLISIEHSLISLMKMAPLPVSPPQTVTKRTTTTTTRRVAVGAAPSYGYVHHSWLGFWIFLAILATVIVGFWVVSAIQESREEARRVAREAEEDRRRQRAATAAAASRPRPDWDASPKRSAPAPAPAPAPVYSPPPSRPSASASASVVVQQSPIVSPVVVPVPVMAPMYPRPYYPPPVVVIDEPIYSPPPAIIEERTTTTVEETTSRGGWSDDSPGGAGGSIDDSPSSSDSDFGGGGGDFGSSDSGSSDSGDSGGSGGDF